jgi:hypothetical protein
MSDFRTRDSCAGAGPGQRSDPCGWWWRWRCWWWWPWRGRQRDGARGAGDVERDRGDRPTQPRPVPPASLPRYDGEETKVSTSIRNIQRLVAHCSRQRSTGRATCRSSAECWRSPSPRWVSTCTSGSPRRQPAVRRPTRPPVRQLVTAPTPKEHVDRGVADARDAQPRTLASVIHGKRGDTGLSSRKCLSCKGESSIAGDYDKIRIDMQPLFHDLAITTSTSAASTTPLSIRGRASASIVPGATAFATWEVIAGPLLLGARWLGPRFRTRGSCGRSLLATFPANAPPRP